MPALKEWDGVQWLTVGGMGVPQVPVSFCAYKTANQTGIAYNTLTKLSFPAVEWNIGGIYDTATSIFRPGFSGLFSFTLSLEWVTFADQASYLISLYKNGSLYRRSPLLRAEYSSWVGGTFTCLAKCLPTDYFEAYITNYDDTARDVSAGTGTYMQMVAIPDSAPVQGTTAITQAYTAPTGASDGALWLDLSQGIPDVSTYVDLTAATSDYPLKRGEMASLNYTNATSVPLRIATVEGVYEISIRGNLTGALTNNSSVYLEPNAGGLAAGAIDYMRLHSTGSMTTTATPAVDGYTDGSSYNKFLVGSALLLRSFCSVSTITTCKHVSVNWLEKTTSAAYGYYTGECVWPDTSTVWSSLGTIIFPYAQSGLIIVERIF